MHQPTHGPPARRRFPLPRGWAAAALAAALALCAALGGFDHGSAPVSAEPPPASSSLPAAPSELPPEPAPQPVVETVTFSATGDNLIHSKIYQQAAARAVGDADYSFDFCYEKLVSFYGGFDVNWINQETLCTDELAPSTYPCFSTPGDCARSLYRAGFRVFSLANNHSYDKGAAGISATLRFWGSMPADAVTAGLWRDAESPDAIPVHTVNGVTIAYLAYTEHTNGIPRSDAMEARVVYTAETDLMERQVRQADSLADFVVVGVHWGVEDSHTVTAGQQALAQQLADWGADVIVGTHPHVLQNATWLTAADGRRAFVAYSLGNFLSTQSKPDQLIGAVLTLRLQKTTDPGGSVRREVLDPQLHPTVTHYGPGKSEVQTWLFRDYTPELADAHGVRDAYSTFGYDYIRGAAQQYIDPAFLVLD